MVTNAPRFSINIMADKIYFRVYPLYTKHILEREEHYFSHIKVRIKNNQNFTKPGGGGYPDFAKNHTSAVEGFP